MKKQTATLRKQIANGKQLTAIRRINYFVFCCKLKAVSCKLRSGQALRLRSAQAMLVAILIITASALSIGLAIATVSSAEVKIGVNSRSSSQSYYLAETCLKNTLMRFARQDFTTPTSFTDENGSCTIEITGALPYQITSRAQVGRARTNLQATVSVSNEVLNLTSYQEVY